MKLRLEVVASWNRPHEVDSKSPNFEPQLRPQFHKFPNLEVGNLKLRLLVAGVEARVEARVGVELGNFETP